MSYHAGEWTYRTCGPWLAPSRNIWYVAGTDFGGKGKEFAWIFEMVPRRKRLFYDAVKRG
jgi:hypothetical protein